MEGKSAIAAFTLALLLLLAGCGSALPEGFEQDAVEARADEIIGMFYSDDFESIWDMCDENLREILLPGALREIAAPYLQTAGPFVETAKLLVGGNSRSATGAEMAVVLAAIQCTERKMNLLISLNQDMELCGFFIVDLRR